MHTYYVYNIIYIILQADDLPPIAKFHVPWCHVWIADAFLAQVACGTWLITTMLQLGFDSPLPSLCNIVFWALFAVTWIDFGSQQVSSFV